MKYMNLLGAWPRAVVAIHAHDVRGTSPLWWECMAFVERRPSSANLGGAYDVRGTSPPKFVRVRRFWFDPGFLATSGHELTQDRTRTEASTSVQGNLEVMRGGIFDSLPPLGEAL